MAAAAAVAGYLTDVRKFLPAAESDRSIVDSTEEDEVVAKLIAAMTPRPGSKPVARISGLNFFPYTIHTCIRIYICILRQFMSTSIHTQLQCPFPGKIPY